MHRSIRHIGSVVTGWLRQPVPASQEAEVHEAQSARVQAYDSQVIRRAVSLNSPNEVDWLLYASIITDRAKRRYCLERALAINPASTIASSALAQLSGGALDTN